MRGAWTRRRTVRATSAGSMDGKSDMTAGDARPAGPGPAGVLPVAYAGTLPAQPTAYAYSRSANLPVGTTEAQSVSVAGKEHFFGGTDLARTLDAPDHWVLDVAHGATAWTSAAHLPNPRNHLGSAVIGGRVYAVGGQHLTSSSTPRGTLNAYDPLTNAWSTLAPLPVPRSHMAASTFVLDGRLVVAAGYSTTYTNLVSAYDPATSRWTALTPLPEARSSAFGAVLPGSRFLFGAGGGSHTSGPHSAFLAVPTG